VHQVRTAIVHEWLTNYAGSERVVEQLLHVLPEADLYALVDFLPDADRGFLGGRGPPPRSCSGCRLPASTSGSTCR
jgi:hypothetical protein